MLRGLTGLTSLGLAGNQIAHLPEWLGELPGLTFLSLEMLDVYRNPLTTLPEELGGLPALKWIGVEEEVLPDTLRRFGS